MVIGPKPLWSQPCDEEIAHHQEVDLSGRGHRQQARQRAVGFAVGPRVRIAQNPLRSVHRRPCIVALPARATPPGPYVLLTRIRALHDGSKMAESRIRRLDEATANQIAAGEVVERPASVVKELLENALDAGATRISVEVEEGGTHLIRVTDDGHGMGPDDARLSLERHATSKIRSVQDLDRVRTMGFRGEALPSIASVSRFTLTTRTAERDEGFRLTVEGGHIRSEGAVGAALGTTIEVADLFFNVPARKKFLKRAATELTHISDTVIRLALARPKIAFRLRHGARVLLDVPPAADGDPKGRIGRIIGKKVVDALHSIPENTEGPVAVTGYVAEPTMTERTTRGQYVFVNGRFVRDRTVQHAIQEGYRTLMEKGRHPMVILYLQLDPSSFDVNVHPQKTEVRFARTSDIHRAVTQAIRRTLLDQPWLRSGQYAVAAARSASAGTASGAALGAAIARDHRDKGLGAYVGLRSVGPPRERGAAAERQTESGPRGRSPSFEPAPAEDRRPAFRPSPASPDADPLFESTTAARFGGRFSSLEPVGQVLGTYLVCQGPEEMVVIDQHAAHERIAFQRMRSQHQRTRVTAQPLLMPIPIELDEGRAATAAQHADRLGALGFELAPFGGATWLVKATPGALVGANVERLVVDMLDELAQVGQASALEDEFDALLSCAACHSVVRAGDRLSRDEIRALLVQMDEIDFGAHCPHGRPVFVRWSSAELGRMFHRT